MNTNCEKIKAIGALPISSTAKYLGTIIVTCGTKAPKDLCELSGIKRSTVYRALEELFEFGADVIGNSSTIPVIGNCGNDGNCSSKVVPLFPPVGLAQDVHPVRAENESLRDTPSKEVKTLPLPPPQAESEAREGEVAVGHGVFVNCETIRHRNFTISLKAIEMQLVGTVPMDEIKTFATGQALQWAHEIEAGKDWRAVVPDRPANFIRGSIQNRAISIEVGAIRKAKAAKPAVRPAHMSRY